MSEFKLSRVLRSALASVIAGLLVRLGFLHWRRARLARRFPLGPPASGLLGNLLDVRRAGSLHGFLRQLHERFGTEDFVRFFLGPQRLVLALANPAMATDVLAQATGRPRDVMEWHYPYLAAGNLMLETRPDVVRDLRKRMNRIAGSDDVCRQVHANTVSMLLREVVNWSRAPIDAAAELGPMMYDVVGETLFQKLWAGQGGRIRSAHMVVATHAARHAPLRHKLVPEHREYMAQTCKLHDMVAELYAQRAAQVAANPKQFERDFSPVTVMCFEKHLDGTAFFDTASAADALIGIMDMAYFATHAALVSCLHLLAEHAPVQAAVAKAVDGALGRKLPPQHKDMALPALDAFVTEALRVRPPVPVIARVSDDDDAEIALRLLPKGVTVLIDVPSRNEAAAGTQFDFERWLGTDRRDFAFGAGPRACPGDGFALAQLKAALVVLLQRFTVEDAGGAGLLHFKERVMENTL